MSSRRKQLIWIFAAFAIVMVADQVTKAIIIAKIPEQHFVDFSHPRFFEFTHQRNPGLVGGMFSNQPILAKSAPILATLVLLYLYRFLDKNSRFQSFAYGLIAGGAIGNLTDRLRLGSVTDFLQFHFYFIPFDFPWKYYPAFNVADSCICTGVFLLIVTWYLIGDKKPEESEKGGMPPAAGK